MHAFSIHIHSPIEITTMNYFFNTQDDIHSSKSVTATEDTDLPTKTVEYCFVSINEANIADIIKADIPYYTNHFQIVEDYDFIHMHQLQDGHIDKVHIDDNNKKYLIFKYSSDICIDFNDYLFQFECPKRFLSVTLTSFSYLLRGLIELNGADICFFNVSPQHIVFNLNCGENAQFTNFQCSLQTPKISIRYITNIIEKIENYVHKPIEVHLLFYLLKNDMATVSYLFIENICTHFVSSFTVLHIFSAKIRDKYKQDCIDCLKKYINMPKNNIILDICDAINTWDAYGLSVLYLHIFGNFTRVFSLKEDCMSKLCMVLYKTISPDPSIRGSLEELRIKADEIIYGANNWKFVNNLDKSRMPKLFEILQM